MQKMTQLSHAKMAQAGKRAKGSSVPGTDEDRPLGAEPSPGHRVPIWQIPGTGSPNPYLGESKRPGRTLPGRFSTGLMTRQGAVRRPVLSHPVNHVVRRLLTTFSRVTAPAPSNATATAIQKSRKSSSHPVPRAETNLTCPAILRSHTTKTLSTAAAHPTYVVWIPAIIAMPPTSSTTAMIQAENNGAGK